MLRCSGEVHDLCAKVLYLLNMTAVLMVLKAPVDRERRAAVKGSLWLLRQSSALALMAVVLFKFGQEGQPHQQRVPEDPNTRSQVLPRCGAHNQCGSVEVCIRRPSQEVPRIADGSLLWSAADGAGPCH